MIVSVHYCKGGNNRLKQLTAREFVMSCDQWVDLGCYMCHKQGMMCGACAIYTRETLTSFKLRSSYASEMGAINYSSNINKYSHLVDNVDIGVLN